MRHLAQTYPFPHQYCEILRRAGIDIDEMLRLGDLPHDLFDRMDVRLTREQFYEIFTVMEQMTDDRTRLAQAIAGSNVEMILPQVYAMYCSANGMQYIKRLERYNTLLEPVRYVVSTSADSLTVEMQSIDGVSSLPLLLVQCEILFLTETLGHATHANIAPISIEDVSVSFRIEDLKRPFLSRDEAVWDQFGKEMEETYSGNVTTMVRTLLIEMLQHDGASIDKVAARLCISRRTLQRKLQDEGTSFKQLLEHARLVQAGSHILSSNESSIELANRLGYATVKSFKHAIRHRLKDQDNINIPLI